jgi:hypothetical protein
MILYHDKPRSGAVGFTYLIVVGLIASLPPERCLLTMFCSTRSARAAAPVSPDLANAEITALYVYVLGFKSESPARYLASILSSSCSARTAAPRYPLFDHASMHAVYCNKPI